MFSGSCSINRIFGSCCVGRAQWTFASPLCKRVVLVRNAVLNNHCSIFHCSPRGAPFHSTHKAEDCSGKIVIFLSFFIPSFSPFLSIVFVFFFLLLHYIWYSDTLQLIHYQIEFAYICGIFKTIISQVIKFSLNFERKAHCMMETEWLKMSLF